MITPKTRKHIEKLSENLSSISKDYSHIHQYKREIDQLLNNAGIKWKVYSNKRIICGVSRTLDGNNITEDYTSCVIKFEPEANSWIPNKYNNQCEIEVWEKSVNTGDEDLFGTVLDYGDNGKWLLMKEYIPVFSSQIEKVQNHNIKDKFSDYIIIEDENFLDQFKNRMENTKWTAYDLRGGNIGFDPDSKRYVLLDYGSSIKYK